MTTDVLGIVRWIDADGKTHYRCRGIGTTYDAFYEWSKTTSYRSTSDDWPWDFFVFDDPVDDQRITEQFGQHLMDDYD